VQRRCELICRVQNQEHYAGSFLFFSREQQRKITVSSSDLNAGSSRAVSRNMMDIADSAALNVRALCALPRDSSWIRDFNQ
jgi:hypothetical protein